MAGAIWQQNGFLREIGDKFPALNYITDYYSNSYNNFYNGRSNNNYYNNPYNYQSGGYPQQNQQYGNSYEYDRNKNSDRDGRPKVILPGDQTFLR